MKYLIIITALLLVLGCKTENEKVLEEHAESIKMVEAKHGEETVYKYKIDLLAKYQLNKLQPNRSKKVRCIIEYGVNRDGSPNYAIVKQCNEKMIYNNSDSKCLKAVNNMFPTIPVPENIEGNPYESSLMFWNKR